MIFKPTAQTSRRRTATTTRNRIAVAQSLEPRRLMTADPIHVGLVYLETDYLETDQDVGSDSQGDRFILSFTGGAADTRLSELRVRTDKDGDGITVGDPIFDTAAGGRGKAGFADFQIVRTQTADGRGIQATAEVLDGGQELVLRLSDFRAGDRLEFTIDVDEVLRNSLDLALFNDRLDVITSGQEFQDSILEATFDAPHYETATADAIFLNDYGDPSVGTGLDLPPDEGDDIDSRPDRSAAAVGSVTQSPKPVEIAGTVWEDENLDLIRQASEPVLSGVTLSLFRQNESGDYIDTGHVAQTDVSGRYRFDASLRLAPGRYRVEQTQPPGFFSVGSVPGTVEGTSTGRSEGDDVLTDIVIPRGDTAAIDFDFAEARPATISGSVYEDLNQNATRDVSENGIAGVEVRLVPIETISPQPTLSMQTLGDGSYSFGNLAPGRYEVIEVVQPAGYADGEDSAGTIDGVVVGIADSPGDAIREITLTSGDEGIRYDFGEFPFGSIEGSVYLAAPGEDCFGPHDGETQPLEGVFVFLRDEFGALVDQTITDAGGNYRFDGVPIGRYTVIEQTPEGLLEGSAHVGTIADVTVGRAVTESIIDNIVLPPAGEGIRYDFCEAAPATISGYVYEDDSDDGVRDPGEQPISGASVHLVDSSDNVVAQTRTDAEGFYQFLGVVPGEYRILEEQPTGYLDGQDSPGRIENRPGTGVPAGTRVGNDVLGLTILQGQRAIEFNFGELRPATLSGRVHVDTDGDCVFDEGESPLAGVTIRLLDTAGEEVAVTTTDSEGRYRFENIRPGNYTIVEDQPAGFFDGDARVGSAGGDRTGPNRVTRIELGAGVDGRDYDFCEEPPSSIAGNVFADVDEDCVRDAGEIGIGGVVVRLLDGDGREVARTTTDADGRYRFDGLTAGDYTVIEEQPDGFLHGGQRAGSGGGDDSVADVISDIRLSAGTTLVNYDFCEVEPGSIRGTVIADRDGDCVQDPDEAGIAGVTITLYDDADEIVAVTQTDADGNYFFEGLAPGRYRIVETQPEDFLDGDESPGTGNGWVIANDQLGLDLAPGESLVEYDFCEIPPGSISGSVIADRDGDCIRDPEDGPIQGVEIVLYDDTDAIVSRTMTDAAGEYRFDNLPPGRYRIVEVQPEAFLDGDESPGTGNGWVIANDELGVVLSAGEILVDYDFCEIPPASIGGHVWVDVDTDRIFDDGEEPLPGVIVELIHNGDRIATTTTDVDGGYRFDGLYPGVYTIREQQPDGYFHGGEVVGDSGGRIADDDLITEIDLLGGTDSQGYDFPEVPPAKLSGYVFQDGDAIELVGQLQPEELRQYRDGLRTSDDTPLAGVEIELRNLLGFPFPSDRALPGIYPGDTIRVTTDANGYYEFPGLRPGSYHVYQTGLDAYIDGLDTPGSTGGLAVNPADDVDDDGKFLIETLSSSVLTNPNNDALLNVGLSAGGESSDNNFSEVLVTQLPPPPPIDDLDEPATPVTLVRNPIQTFLQPIRLVTFAAPRDITPPPQYADDWAVSWHLSVINGGYPPGTEAEESVFRSAMFRLGSGDGDDYSSRHNYGRWLFYRSDGTLIERSNELLLGDDQSIPLTGDFDGDGTDEVALYHEGHWYVDFNADGVWNAKDLWIRLGTALDRPVVGDWDGDGKDDVGIFGRQWERDPVRIKHDPGLPDPANHRRRQYQEDPNVPSERGFAKNTERLFRRGTDGRLRADAVDHVFKFGEQPDTPLAGDWNGDGIDQIGVFRDGRYLLDANGDGRWSDEDIRGDLGRGGQPVVGDFDGDGVDEVAVVRGEYWIIDTDGDRRFTGADQVIRVPREGNTTPVVGDFDGDGKDDLGYFRPAG